MAEGRRPQERNRWHHFRNSTIVRGKDYIETKDWSDKESSSC